MSKGRIFSGMQPSGKFHLGNYLGALENWIKLQQEYECFFSIVDLHALTSSYEDTSKLPENIYNMALDWLSAGLDPEKNVVFIQSHVKEHAELHLLLSMMTPLSWLERVPIYKDKIQQVSLQGKDLNTYGFLGYPELMTADIILYKADTVPVGEDQLPHLELSREIVRRFNYLYRPIFPEPEASLTKASILPGIDGRKMSKSYGNDISFSATPDEIRSRVKLMITDPQRVKRTDCGHPEVCTAYKFHQFFSKSELSDIEQKCRQAEIGCVDCKKRLAENLVTALSEVHARRQTFESSPQKVRDILAFGAERARKVASQTMEEVRDAMHLS
jgi:tryptophanyl-tRNA synthetase